jgi:hypothetical protein
VSTEAYSQLSLLDLLDESGLAATLVDHRRMPVGPSAGPARLLRRLVRLGLAEEALPAAAGLVLALNERHEEDRASG